MNQKLMQSIKVIFNYFKTGFKLLIVNFFSSILLIIILTGLSTLGLSIERIDLPRLIFSILLLSWQFILTQQLTKFKIFKPKPNREHKNKLLLATSSVYLLLLFLIFG